MHRTTILLPPDLRRKADREARSLGISLSELIRRRLSAGEDTEPVAKPKFYGRQPWQSVGVTDTAANHDQYLYGP